MKTFNLIAAGAAVAAGLAGGTATYLVAAQPAPSSQAPPVRTADASTTTPAPVAARSKPIVRLAPCKPPAVREGKACVTEVVETVVIPAPSSGSAGAPATSALEPVRDGDDDADHGSEATGHADDEGENHAEDAYEGDEDHAGEDEDHADEDHEDEGYDD